MEIYTPRIGLKFSYILIILALIIPVTVAASDWTFIGPAGMRIRDCAVSPEFAIDQEIIIIDEGQGQTCGVHITHDGGATWTTYQIAGQYGCFNEVEYGISPDVIHLAGSNGVGLTSSYDGGANWINHPNTANIWDFSIRGNLIAMSSDWRIGISKDGGNTTTWTVSNSTNGLPAGSVVAIDMSPDFNIDPLILIGSYFGVNRSVDGGQSWTSVTGLPPSGSWGEQILISPAFSQDKTVYAFVSNVGLYKSIDRGVSWTRAYEPRVSSSTEGICLSPSYATDGTLMFSGWNYDEGKCFTAISRDRAATWTIINTTLPGVWNNANRCIFSPNFAVDQRIYLINGDNGLYTRTLLPDPVPVANDDSYTTAEDQLLSVISPGVLGNDLIQGTATATVTAGPSHGILELNMDGSFTYTPAINYHGTDSFTYIVTASTQTSAIATVTIIVTDVNDPPQANDDGATTAEDNPVTVNVLANDIDIEGSPMNFLAATEPVHGTIQINADKQIIYTPEADFNGDDTFTYQVSDGELSSSPATVTIIVTPVNDAPSATADTYFTDEDTLLTISSPGVLANDGDIDSSALAVMQIQAPSHGTLVLNSDGAFTYSPAINFEGMDTFTYQVSDGVLSSDIETVMITVTPLNDPAVIGDLTSSINPVSLGTSVTMNAPYSDPDLTDTHTAVWNWGDGNSAQGVIEPSQKIVTGSHLYATVGVYTVTLTLTDSANSQAQSQYQFIVVFNPASGYVSGHGRIFSPAGALVGSSIDGDASFGFVSKYQKGATIPDGSTRFRFQVADFEFKSTSYEWLVVAGAKAQYKGLGEINGQGPYKFILSAIDADQNPSDLFTIDRFRLKIWTEDASGEQVVYDNALGNEVDSSSSTEITKGEIDIRKDAV